LEVGGTVVSGTPSPSVSIWTELPEVTLPEPGTWVHSAPAVEKVTLA
jgi:hypothetical protein